MSIRLKGMPVDGVGSGLMSEALSPEHPVSNTAVSAAAAKLSIYCFFVIFFILAPLVFQKGSFRHPKA